MMPVENIAQSLSSPDDMSRKMPMITIVNLTPHPVTIIRRCPNPSGPPEAIIEHVFEYPACAPSNLPRATEAPVQSDMCLTDGGSDGQGGYENARSLAATGLVDNLGYTGIEGLPPLTQGERMFGVTTFLIVSVVTAIGALAAGRGVEDLLIPMGQVRDASGRIVGATSLAPAASLLTPLYRAIVAPYNARIMDILRERNAARGVAPTMEQVAEIERQEIADGARYAESTER